jgi:curved DNA-binding protein CbpA
MTYYDTLGVPKTADASAIKRAYRKKARAAHPDRQGGDAQTMAGLNLAYGTLADPAKRNHYDKTGQDTEPEKPADHEATGIILKLLGAVMEQADEHQDLLDIVRQQLKRNQTNLTNEQARLRGVLQKHEKLRQRFKYHAKVTTRNILDDFLAQRIGALEAQIEQLEKAHALGDRAAELLTDYGFKTDRRPPQIAAFNPWAPVLFYSTS